MAVVSSSVQDEHEQWSWPHPGQVGPVGLAMEQGVGATARPVGLAPGVLAARRPAVVLHAYPTRKRQLRFERDRVPARTRQA